MQSNDYKWFLKNHNALFEKYGFAYVAIKNGKVLGVYKSYAEGVKKTSLQEEMGTFIVQKCGADESSYTNYISSTLFLN